MTRNRNLHLLGAAALFGLGCGLFRSGSPAERGGEPFEVEIVAADHLNPDEHGESLPTAIQILQLTSTAKVEGADPEQIYRRAKETLGPDLLQLEEVTLLPGQKLRRRIERDRSAKALALVAIVRRPTGASWRAIAPLAAAPPRAGFRFVIEGYRIDRQRAPP